MLKRDQDQGPRSGDRSYAVDGRLRGDLLDILEGSTLWFDLEDLVADLKVWPLQRGEKLRRELTAKTVEPLLQSLVGEGLVIADPVNGFRLRREPVKVEKQGELF